VVDSPGIIRTNFPPAEADDLLGKSKAPRAGIPDVVEFLRKTVEIVDYPGDALRRYPGTVGLPMGGDAQDCPGKSDLAPESFPSPGIDVVIDGVHGIAMTHEKNRHEHVRCYERRACVYRLIISTWHSVPLPQIGYDAQKTKGNE
jgi:hypothetical protein